MLDTRVTVIAMIQGYEYFGCRWGGVASPVRPYRFTMAVSQCLFSTPGVTLVGWGYITTHSWLAGEFFDNITLKHFAKSFTSPTPHQYPP